MENHRAPIPEDRDLTPAEERLVRWLLDHATRDVGPFRSQLDDLRVVSRCQCGCPSIDFAPSESGQEILADYVYHDSEGRPIGVFLFASAGRLAGIEVWSIAGDPVPDALPEPESLRPLSSLTRPVCR